MCDISIAENSLNLVVSEPEQIKGLTVNINNDEITAEFTGISYSQELTSLPHGSVALVLFNVLNDVSTRHATIGDENCVIIGRVDGYNYSFDFSPSGLPLFLKIDDLDLEIEFNNVTIK